MIELIDTHCHLDYDYAPKVEADLIKEAAAKGVSTMVTIGVDMGSLERLPAIAERNPNVYFTLGIHPHEAATVQEGDLERLKAAARHPKCRGIGEIGLDYHYDHSPREIQRKVFRDQPELALELKKPIIVHSREGEEDLLADLTEYAGKVTDGRPAGIIHCFSGTRAFGEACVKLGFYISFSGILTFKKADELRDAAAAIPLERILVETDSPYLAPMPHRGKKCEPWMVTATAEKLAEVKALHFAEVARVTTENARRVFGI